MQMRAAKTVAKEERARREAAECLKMEAFAALRLSNQKAAEIMEDAQV